MSRFTEADRLLRLIVRERVRCERCGGIGSQVAHILRRRFNATRCDERNTWWLCGGPGSNDCHATVDQYVEEQAELIDRTIGGEVLDELWALALAGPSEPLSAFWKSETARLRERCSALGIATRRAS